MKPKILKSLISMAQRRSERLVAALADERLALAQRQHETSSARAALDQHANARAAIVAELDRLTSAPFSADALIAANLREQEAAHTLANAADVVEQRRKDEAVQAGRVQAAQSAIRRNDRRLESLREHLTRIERENEKVLEAAAEEETEETSVARSLAARRGAAASI
ncbi:hypothetical protein OOZ63_27590 [Paucibacter sp. PLA-PC-4]|uniref:hypothetical protein n=1 Tax=Paucibacter sp. PLA-PC-4 TaxID=2993655 RepID=UPI00224A94E0|nr:hypothetical protein [Paucibacter sp. PLA-PC-4]MCX2865591.1 hypothetical protein [Paucibacter sp. PLA-PC-4]